MGHMLESLICPHCAQTLIEAEKEWFCPNNHHFDKAKSGVTHLLTKNSPRSHGDNKALIQARHRFLQAGNYRPLLDALIEQMKGLPISNMCDLGCGEGYYTNALAQTFPALQIIGFDLSKDGLNLAAKGSKQVRYFCASIANLPLHAHTTDLVLSVFAPVFPKEIRRIVRPNGYLLLVQPNPEHLLELKQVLYPQVRLNPVAGLKEPGFKLISERRIRFAMDLHTAEEKNALLDMTPYAYTSRPEAIERYYGLKALTVYADFSCQLYEIEADNLA